MSSLKAGNPLIQKVQGQISFCKFVNRNKLSLRSVGYIFAMEFSTFSYFTKYIFDKMLDTEYVTMTMITFQ